MKSVSISAQSGQSFIDQLDQAMEKGFAPNLCIAFCDAEFEFPHIVKTLFERDIDLIGATTCGELHNDQTVIKSFTALLVDAPKESYKILLNQNNGSVFQSAAEIGVQVSNTFQNPAVLIYAAGNSVNGDELVKGIKSTTSDQMPLFGGLAGDDMKNEKIKVFGKGQIESNGNVALVFDGDRIEVAGNSYSGWQELGRTHTITKAEGNVLYEVDHLPALDLFKEYFGELVFQSNTESEREFQMPGIFPLKINTTDDSIYMRSPLTYDAETRALILAGEVEDGQKFKFCPMPDAETIDDTLNYFNNYAEKNKDVDCIIINSCMGRKVAFGPLLDDEMQGLHKLWNVPLVGFLALGEIGNNYNSDICNFHNVTCSLVTLKEK